MVETSINMALLSYFADAVFLFYGQKPVFQVQMPGPAPEVGQPRKSVQTDADPHSWPTGMTKRKSTKKILQFFDFLVDIA
jgi:hypothetical protein